VRACEPLQLFGQLCRSSRHLTAGTGRPPREDPIGTTSMQSAAPLATILPDRKTQQRTRSRLLPLISRVSLQAAYDEALFCMPLYTLQQCSKQHSASNSDKNLNQIHHRVQRAGSKESRHFVYPSNSIFTWRSQRVSNHVLLSPSLGSTDI